MNEISPYQDVFGPNLLRGPMLANMIENLLIMNKFDNYKFKVSVVSDINYKKIADDLSYSDPIRLVQFGNKNVIVIHHTIYDKYCHSKCSILGLEQSIKNGYDFIESKQIKEVVKQVNTIKKAEWIKISKEGGMEVTVTKVKTV